MTNKPIRNLVESQHKPLITAIVGGGRGCESFLKMVHEDKLGRFRIKIVGIAEINKEASGRCYAEAMGIVHLTEDFTELYDIPDLDLIIELTGLNEVRDTIEKTRPRHVRFIDHFSASLFWELYMAEENIIRQRTEMRERVETEREWINQVFDSLPEEILVLDTDFVVLDANKTFLVNNELTPKDIRGRFCYEIEQNRGECNVDQCEMRQVVESKAPRSLIKRGYNQNGEVRYSAIVIAPITDLDGQVVSVIESTRDITHRIQLEEDLRATETLLKKFMDMAPIAASVKDSNGRYLEVNPAACSLFGQTQQAFLGKTDLELFEPSMAAALRVDDDEVLKTGQTIHREDRISIDGNEVFLSTIKYPVLDPENQTKAVVSLSIDVTDLKETERELTSTRDYLQNVLNNSPDIIITTDMQGLIVSFNPGAEEALGYTREEVFGKPASMLYRKAEERTALLSEVIEKGAVREETMLVRKDDSLIHIILTLSQLKDSEGKMIGTVGIGKDISRRQALADQVMQSERLAAVGRLASGVAHEINNPLAVISEISGYIDDLLKVDTQAQNPETIAEIQTGLPKILDQVHRCRSITQRLLSFARKSEARVEVTDINAAINEILPFWDKQIMVQNVMIHTDLAESLPKVQIEEMQLQEIFINLINNALQALHDCNCGNIWITTRFVDGKVIATVRDDGPGIAEEVKGKLFDPFVTTKPVGEGTGLGLSICYGIIKRYDGRISVDSVPGQGAAFSIILPPYQEKMKTETHF